MTEQISGEMSKIDILDLSKEELSEDFEDARRLSSRGSTSMYTQMNMTHREESLLLWSRI